MRGRLRHHTTLLAVVALAVICGTAGAVALAQSGSDDAARHAVDFTKVTPSPYYVTTPTFPDYSKQSHCQLPDNERTSPDLPPLSCRNSGSEPPPGTIPTADPAVVRPRAVAPAGFQVLDNRLFRFTVQMPDSWYSDMRPEGGAFHVLDPIGTQEVAQRRLLAGGGISMYFSARTYIAPRVPDGFQPAVEQRLKQPNLTLAGTAGVTWDEGPGEGLAHQIGVAFVRDGVVYEGHAGVEDDGRSSVDIQADVDIVNAIIASISPY